jgi:anti-sigma factor RsiW
MAMTHPETALVPYIRGELSGREHDSVASHLEQCGECRASAESFRALLGELSARIEELPTPDWTIYRAQLRRKLAERMEPRPRWWHAGWAWASLATASAAAVAILALWFAIPGTHRNLAPPADQLAMEQQMDVAYTDADVGLLRNYGVVERLDLLENYDVIAHLDQLAPAPQPDNAVRS